VPILAPEHDFAHPVEPDSAWSESYYFNAYDPGSDSGFFTRIGVRPNEGTMDVGFSAWLPGGELAEYRHVVTQREMVGPPLVVGGVRYELLDPMKSWRIVADVEAPARACRRGGEPTHSVHLVVDVRFDAVSPAVGTDGQRSGAPHSEEASAATGTTGKGHLEQAGRWSGSMTIDGATHAWGDAFGNRDRSWGPRRWGGPSMWRWFSINLGESMHLGGIRLGTSAGDLHRGWVLKDAQVTSIKEWRLRTELADDGLTQRVVHAVVVDKRDRTFALTGEVQRVADIGRAGGTVVNEGLTRWTYRADDGSTLSGHGIAEYLHQLDESGKPAVPVA
jgi:hypothetical protein